MLQEEFILIVWQQGKTPMVSNPDAILAYAKALNQSLSWETGFYVAVVWNWYYTSRYDRLLGWIEQKIWILARVLN